MLLAPGRRKGCPTTKKSKPLTAKEKWAAHLLICPRCAVMAALSREDEWPPAKTAPEPDQANDDGARGGTTP